MSDQADLKINDESKLDSIETYKFGPIKGYPMLSWKGKRPFTSTQYYPAQLRENHGEARDGWMNRIYWGDNLQVMSHLLKEFRGKVDLIYIDPPFDSKADYKKTISVKGVGKAVNDISPFEEKQYSDIWTNDEYLQFMYERLILLKELMSDKGSIYIHCDWHKNAHLRCICDEVFGPENIRNEIVWCYFGFKRATSRKFPQKHDTILSYVKSEDYTWNVQFRPHSEEYKARFKKDATGRLFRDDVNPTAGGARVIYLDQVEGDIIESYWNDIPPVNPVAKERMNYPTQKPERLAERIILSSTKPGDLVFDAFMGSGTLPAVASKTNRRFIGADINLGAVQTATKRLCGIREEMDLTNTTGGAVGFSVYNVNHYDIFRNPTQAKSILIEAMEIQALPNNSLFDGEKDGRMVKIMPINRIATKADLTPLITGFDYRSFQKKQETAPNKPVESILLVCMGHEPDLAAHLKRECHGFALDVEVVDILRDKANLEFKRDSEAEIVVEEGKLKIAAFYPMNLLQKLSLQKEKIGDWRELTESVMIDWNYDGGVFEPTEVDVPDKDVLVRGEYAVPKDAGTIRVKITDLLSESLEMEVSNGRR
jgi:DNA modification methylase